MTTKNQVSSASSRQVIRTIVREHLSTHFANTLGKEYDIENLVMGLIYKESSFNPSARHRSVPLTTSSTGRRFYNAPAIAAKRAKGTPQEVSNINQGLRAWGLMAVMGWNLLKGGAPGGKTEIESSRPDLSSQLMLNPGEDISVAYDGDSNISRQILAGIVMLEAKYKAVKQTGTSFSIGGKTFSSRLSAAFGAYLGTGGADALGTTAESYIRSIMYGPAYSLANSGKGNMAVANKPKTATLTLASGKNEHPTGC